MLMNYREDLVRSCKYLNFPAHLSKNDMLVKKSRNLTKKFRLTTLPSQSVEAFFFGRKTEIHIFTIM